MSDHDQPPEDFSQIENPPVPEGWQESRPRRSRLPQFNWQSARILIAIGLVLVVSAWLGISAWEQRQWRKEYARERGREGFKSEVRPVVRWEYKTLTVKADDAMKDADGRYNSTRFQRAMESRSHFFFTAFNELDKLGEAGWELVSATPNIETVFPVIKDYQDRSEPRPNTRVAEVILFLKRPSKYGAITDQEMWDQEKRMKEYESKRSTNRTVRP